MLESTVAAPIENAINGVENMLYMSSTSAANGVVQIQVTFNIGADVDKAALNVNNRVKQAEPRLPQEVRRQGVTVEKGSSAFLQVLAFSSPDASLSDLVISNYVTLNVLDEVKRIPGTTNVQIFGAKDYAMRIWLRPDRLAQLKLSPTDIFRAINEQNAQFAAGKVGEPPTGGGQDVVYTVTTKGRLSEAKEFEDIILRANPDGSRLRLKDVARIELAGKDYSFIGKYNGRPATLMGIFLQPGANALDAGKAVKARVDELKARFPKGLEYNIAYDTTRFVEVSIREVVYTLLEAMALVFLVIFVFLQNWRATLIPFAAVPVALLGTFAGLLIMATRSTRSRSSHGAVHRHRGGRRDRRPGKRRAHHARGGPGRARGGDQGDEGSHQPDHRHRAGAVRGIHPDRVPGRPHRRALPAVRGHHLDRGGDLGLRRHDAHAEPVRVGSSRTSTRARTASRAPSTAGSRAPPTATRTAWRG